MESSGDIEIVNNNNYNNEDDLNLYQEVTIDTNKLQERFRFFEEFKEKPKEPRRVEILLQRSDTARKMLGKFKQLESQASVEGPPPTTGPKPLKRITPPRDIVNGNETNGNGVTIINGKDRSPERDPNIVRATYKSEDIIPVTPEMARNLRNKFENWTQPRKLEKSQSCVVGLKPLKRITPPREMLNGDTNGLSIISRKDGSPERDPNIVRATYKTDDIVPVTPEMARNLRNKFENWTQPLKQSDSQASVDGPKPLKRITPPREMLNGDTNGDGLTIISKKDGSPERDPNIVRATYKTDDIVPVTPEMARSLCNKFENWTNETTQATFKTEDIVPVAPEITRSLRAKFENWKGDIERENNKNTNGTSFEADEFTPSIDTTKNLKAKFEAIKFESKQPVESKPKLRVNRFVQEQAANQAEECSICGKRLYPLEKLEFNGVKLHKTCFKCTHCSSSLRIENYTFAGGKFYCIAHFKQLFMAKGNYDEGFGNSQHKEKWNSRTSSRNQTPDDLEGSEEVEESESTNVTTTTTAVDDTPAETDAVVA